MRRVFCPGQTRGREGDILGGVVLEVSGSLRRVFGRGRALKRSFVLRRKDLVVEKALARREGGSGKLIEEGIEEGVTVAVMCLVYQPRSSWRKEKRYLRKVVGKYWPM